MASAAFAILGSLCLVSVAHAFDSASVEIGQGNDDTNIGRVGVQSDWARRWFTERSWTLSAYWDLQLGLWRGSGPDGRKLWDIGLTPVFRLERAGRTRVIPYFEAAIGFHYLSGEQVNRARNLSSSFQFGDHIGAGVRFGPLWRYDASMRLQHLSNAGIERPNPGINFVQLRLAYHL